jgi:fructose/tagatose bisphosphate aldolase
MPLILERTQVLNIYDEAESRGWVLPAFNSENLTTSEAILAAVSDYGREIGADNLPIIIGITNNYPDRPQSCFYSHTQRWDIGLRLFLNDLKVLASKDSPYGNLRIMIHLDHMQWDKDQDLLNWDISQFSSIMFDASTLTLEQNIQKTAEFVNRYGKDILVEGACDEIGKSTEDNEKGLTMPEEAKRFKSETGVDIIVANLGTEHRASAANLRYRPGLARKISALIGPCLCLHGTSSVPMDSISQLFNDGIRRVNIWTVLERESSVKLFRDMIENAAKIIGSEKTQKYISEGLLGANVDSKSKPSIGYFTTHYRQKQIFHQMKKIVTGYLNIFFHLTT